MANKKLLTEAELRAAVRSGQDLGDVELRRAWDTTVKASVDVSRALDFTISTGTVDRMGDTVSADGWKLTNYRKNPVVLWSHDSSSPPIARAMNVRAKDGKLKARAEFADGKMDPTGLAEQVYQMLKGGFLSATSVGFAPIKYQFVEGNSKRPFGIDFVEQELLEFSIVGVPANPEALIEARAAGIDIGPMVAWCERVMKGQGSAVIPEADLEFILRVAREDEFGGRIRRLFGGFLTPKDLRASKGVAEGEADAEAAAAADAAADESAEVVEQSRGVCGRAVEKDCGMRDPVECKTHSAMIAAKDLSAPALLTLLESKIKAGRVLSTKNEGDLRSAVTLIQGVLDLVSAAADAEEGKSGAAAEETREARKPSLFMSVGRKRLEVMRRTVNSMAAART